MWLTTENTTVAQLEWVSYIYVHASDHIAALDIYVSQVIALSNGPRDNIADKLSPSPTTIKIHPRIYTIPTTIERTLHVYLYYIDFGRGVVCEMI